jgi:2-polyprenyl-6-hydroxyphenyl methylase/3-demethylubiquinone-9 3-methyltransferase
MTYHSNSDAAEIAKFSALADHWWDLSGPCKPLHIINPTRVEFIQAAVELKDKTVLDIGCGGGILSESLARKGAKVTGIDLSEAAIEVAQAHAKAAGLAIAYSCSNAESFNQGQFDIVTCMELLEHVPDPACLVQACTRLVKPQGHVFFSTINRTLSAYMLAILGAEYITRMLPIGTHDYAKFIKPSELCAWLRTAGLQVDSIKGIHYRGISHKSSLCDNPDVNYILHARA